MFEKIPLRGNFYGGVGGKENQILYILSVPYNAPRGLDIKTGICLAAQLIAAACSLTP